MALPLLGLSAGIILISIGLLLFVVAGIIYIIDRINLAEKADITNVQS